MRILYPLLCSALAAAAQNAPKLALEKIDDGYRVTIDGQLFTEHHTAWEGVTKPVLYPVMGPRGIGMTRNFPLRKGVEGEASDHPHHTSLFYTHGDISGVNFWHVGGGDKQGHVKETEVVKAVVEDGAAVLRTRNDWVDGKDQLVFKEDRTQRFSVTASGARAIDIELTFHAVEQDIVFGDTKEGSMGIRTHPALRLKGGRGQAANSEGVTGRDVWGKRAKWVNYTAPIEGHTVGVAIFDHPDNPRHPTTWHARDYGLVAANPFGLHHFEKKPRGAGAYTVPKGESVTFKYRFLFHEDVDVEKDYAAWTR